ncbi:hypothetical protein HMPREF0185_01106 [Brevundimonas diminuta 470-4]|nr:hypothetical protein HMPREF0185_01106 [Brevundimonas diminuta 470-4]
MPTRRQSYRDDTVISTFGQHRQCTRTGHSLTAGNTTFRE